MCLDDVLIARGWPRLSWAGWTYWLGRKRKVYGLHVVVLLWCDGDGGFGIPVTFRLWLTQTLVRSGRLLHQAQGWRRSCSGRNPPWVRGSNFATSSSTPTTVPGGLQETLTEDGLGVGRYTPSEDDRLTGEVGRIPRRGA